MSVHLAPEEMLLDFATGALAEGPALAVSLHLALTPPARRVITGLDAIGGVLLEDVVPEPLDDAILHGVLARLEDLAVEPKPGEAAAPRAFPWAPLPLQSYLRGGERWKRVLGSFEEIR